MAGQLVRAKISSASIISYKLDLSLLLDNDYGRKKLDNRLRIKQGVCYDTN